MIALGIDPGLTGAIAAVCSQRGLLDCADLPTCGNGSDTGKVRSWLDVAVMRALLRDWSARYGFASESVRAFLERPIPMPSMPTQTLASQFDTFGALRTLLSERAEVDVIAPKAWKGLFGLKADKDASRACCLRLYPSAPVARVKDHNRAEAVLIAHWGLRKVMGAEERQARHAELCDAF